MRAAARLFLIAGVGSMAAAAVVAVRRMGASALPDPAAFGLAAVALAAGLAAATGAWLLLLRGAAAPIALARGFVLGQLGKYIPGGIWLGAGQIGLAARAGVAVPRAAGALAVLGIAIAAAAGVAAALGWIFVSGTAGSALACGTGAVALVTLLHRRRLAWLGVVIGGRVAKRTGSRVKIRTPSQRAIVEAFALGFATVVAGAVAYALLLHSLAPTLPVADIVAAFTAAWLAGYLVPGLPSGIGAREAVLVALLPIGIAPVVAASLAQRVALMLVEVLFALALHVRVRVPVRPLAESSAA